MALLEYVAPDGTIHQCFLLGFTEGKAILAWEDSRQITEESIEKLTDRSSPWRLALTLETVIFGGRAR